MTKETTPAIKEKFNEWLKLSKKERIKIGMPEQKDFAIHHGVASSQLSQWKRFNHAVKSNGDFDLQEYLKGELPGIAKALVDIIGSGKSNTKAIELSLKALGELVEKREDTIKVDYTPTERIRIAREVIDGLKSELNGGYCVICGQYKALRNGVGMDTESEHTEDREVETVELLT